jgi:hypothetical protein
VAELLVAEGVLRREVTDEVLLLCYGERLESRLYEGIGQGGRTFFV